jgi:hypothetical protein
VRIAKLQGNIAGLNISGKTIAFLKPISFNVTRLAGLTTTIIGSVGSGGKDPDLLGIARGDSESWRYTSNAGDKKLISAQSEFDVNRIRLIMGEVKLVGAIIMGDQTLSKPLQYLISQEVDITPIRDQLISPVKPLAETIGILFTMAGKACDLGQVVQRNDRVAIKPCIYPIITIHCILCRFERNTNGQRVIWSLDWYLGFFIHVDDGDTLLHTQAESRG